MNDYNRKAKTELRTWQRQMQRSPSFLNGLTRTFQTRINKIIPEKVHKAITSAIKQMIKAVLFGAGISSSKPEEIKSLELTEAVLNEKLKPTKELRLQKEE